MSVAFRKYNVRKDRKAVHRIWQECGWITQEKREIETLDLFVRTGSAWVGEIGGSAETLSLATPGTFRHTGSELSLAAITAVTTSRLGRNQGGATGTLARLLAEQAATGVQVSGLGIFEQGYYDRLGYGNGTYELWIRFDPAWLADLGKPRLPVRLTPEDWKEIHSARLRRRKAHGAVDLLSPEITRAEMAWSKNSFGLGYRTNGELSHFFVAHCDNVESGPYTIDWMVYSTFEQFRELIALMRGLGDQVRNVRMREPRDVQMQSLLRRPFQLYQITAGSKEPSRVNTVAYWQLRILDVEACLAGLACTVPVEFNLTLHDPIADLLPDDCDWKGCGGEYTVRLATSSSATEGHTPGLPELSSSVNDLTRFWMGSASAEVLAGLGSFDAPADLIESLDRSVRVPDPAPDWDY